MREHFRRQRTASSGQQAAVGDGWLHVAEQEGRAFGVKRAREH